MNHSVLSNDGNMVLQRKSADDFGSDRVHVSVVQTSRRTDSFPNKGLGPSRDQSSLSANKLTTKDLQCENPLKKKDVPSTLVEHQALSNIVGTNFRSKATLDDNEKPQQREKSLTTQDAPQTLEELQNLSNIAGVSFRSTTALDETSVSTIEDKDNNKIALSVVSSSCAGMFPTQAELQDLAKIAGVCFVSAPMPDVSESRRPESKDDESAVALIESSSRDESEHYKKFQGAVDGNGLMESNGSDYSQPLSITIGDGKQQKEDPTMEDILKIIAGGEDSNSSDMQDIYTNNARWGKDFLALRKVENSEHEDSKHLLPTPTSCDGEARCGPPLKRVPLTVQAGDESQSSLAPEQPKNKRRKSETLEIKDKLDSRNRPHPALATPLLYFFLRRCPWLFERIKTLYAFRWSVAYPLQKKVPFSFTLRKVGIYLTWGEVFLLLPFFGAIIAGILYTVLFPSVKTTGKVARFALIAAFVFCQRNSLFTLLLGVPFDRSIFYHKLAGRVAGVTGALHTVAFFIDPAFQDAHRNDMIAGAFTGQVNIAGSVLMLLIAGITVSSLPRFRRQLFELFYYAHVVFTVGMVVCAFFHSGKLVPIVALLTWGADLFIRYIVMARTRYPRNAFLNKISDTVVEVSFPKTAAFAYNPGQYVFLAIPEISWLQWHPISISSSPEQRVVTLHIRNAGNWTAALFDLAREKKEVSILLEGPYGNISVDIMSDKTYKNIMLISGGIGMTPMQSICDQLLYEKAKGRRDLHHIKFIWIERDPILMQSAEFVRRTSSIGSVGFRDLEEYMSSRGSMSCFNESDHFDGQRIAQQSSQNALNQKFADMLKQEHSIDVASQLLSVVAPGKTTDEELDKLYESEQLFVDSETYELSLIKDKPEASMATGCDEPNKDPPKKRPSVSCTVEEETSFADNCGSWPVEAPPVVESLVPVLDMQVYLTGESSSATEEIPFARLGRPNIEALFQEMKKKALSAGDSHVAVCVSAPKRLTDLCRKACLLFSDKDVQFDLHAECRAF